MSDTADHILVSGGFDDVRCHDVRFLEEASRLGLLHVLLWSDEALRAETGREPEFPLAERLYFLQALRYVDRVHIVEGQFGPHALPATDEVPRGPRPVPRRELPLVPSSGGLGRQSGHESQVTGHSRPSTWVVREEEDEEAKRDFCRRNGLQYRVVKSAGLDRLPEDPPTRGEGVPPLRLAGISPGSGKQGQDALATQSPGRKKVIVTGCYDWLHTGHIRFFEEVSALGDLYVVVGHDANIRLLKGKGHPLFDEGHRRYMVGSIRHVTAALISTGHGWLDAEPEIERIRPDMYAVNEDGDKPEKREYCEKHGIEYVVLKRLPKEGLPRRESTNLRGF